MLDLYQTIFTLGTLLSKGQRILNFIRAFIMARFSFPSSIPSNLLTSSSWTKMVASKPTPKFALQLHSTIPKNGTQLGQSGQCLKLLSASLLRIFKEWALFHLPLIFGGFSLKIVIPTCVKNAGLLRIYYLLEVHCKLRSKLKRSINTRR